MIATLLLTLTCQAPLLVNFGDTLTENDLLTIKNAEKRCPQLYERSPCIAKVEKKSDTNYWVTCGRKK